VVAVSALNETGRRARKRSSHAKAAARVKYAFNRGSATFSDQA
jgi:hypothetical protein